MQDRAHMSQHAPADAAAPVNGAPDLPHLFERARQALAARLNLETGIAEALALSPAAGASDAAAGRVAAQLRIDEHTRQVVVRLYDAQTGATLREFPPAALPALAARLGRTIV